MAERKSGLLYFLVLSKSQFPRSDPSRITVVTHN